MTTSDGAGPSATPLALDRLAGAWLDAVAASGRSANTVSAYRGDVAQYVRWLEQEGLTDVALLGPDDVEAFVQHVVVTPGRGERLRSDATVARLVSAVRGFHAWLHTIGLTVDDAAAGVPPPSAVRATPVTLDRDEVAALLSGVTGDRPADLRDRAVLSLLVATGVRAAEVVALDVAHVAADARVLDVPGERARPLPIPDPRALRTWLDHGRAQLGDASPALFPNSQGQRITRQGVWRLVTRRAVDAGLPAGTSPRTLRNTFAELERAAGTPEPMLLELLGRAPWTGMVDRGV